MSNNDGGMLIIIIIAIYLIATNLWVLPIIIFLFIIYGILLSIKDFILDLYKRVKNVLD